MSPEEKKHPHRILRWLLVSFAGLLLLAGISAAYLRWFSPFDRAWCIRTLEKRYEANVELKSFSASLFPVVDIEGEGLVLRRKDQPEAPPLASVGKFSLNALWLNLLRTPRHLGTVRLEGLVLNIPPRRPDQGVAQHGKRQKRNVAPFVLDDVVADGTTLNVFSANAQKPPRAFVIEKLRMRSAGTGQPMSFEATLTNSVPVGEIHSSGKFGPWNADDPSMTPLAGSYSFQHADLSTIRGLAGILSSEGRYEGVLSQINIEGKTDTPNFALGVTGNPVHLKTEFTALVDGVNGDTFLRPVTAHIGSSTIVARGGIARTFGSPGRTILLTAVAQSARLEDVLRLAVKQPRPPMTGTVDINTSIDIHPGTEDIAKRLKLDGRFAIRSAHFTNADAEQKISSLSRLGQGKRGDTEIQNVALDMQGQFVMANGLVKFSRLSFSVPGAGIQLHGNFGLVSQELDFEGEVRLQAKVSQMTTGIKSVLLKAVDPLFARDGAGIVVPIRISGTKTSPTFGIEVGKIFGRGR
jgi:hypothetical protein